MTMIITKPSLHTADDSDKSYRVGSKYTLGFSCALAPVKKIADNKFFTARVTKEHNRVI